MKQLKVVIDAQFGSTGKGLLASVLAEQDSPDTLITAFAPNAGHTSYMADGTKLIHKMLANGITSKNTERVLIGPGAVINEDVLVREIENAEKLGLLSFDRVFVHKNAACVTPAHIEAEKDFGRIGSTQTGSGAAAIQKLVRDPDNMNTAGTAICDPRIRVVDDIGYLAELGKARVAQIEGAQGFGLSIQHGFYPYTTSRDVSPAQIMADCGIPWRYAKNAEIVGVLRTYPIRVANKTGSSGPCYPDQREISFADIGQDVELTTVTKLPRRVFTYSKNQMEHACLVCGFDSAMINFANYCQTFEELNTIIDHLSTMTKVRYIGFGPKNTDVVDIKGKPWGSAQHELMHRWQQSRQVEIDFGGGKNDQK